MSSAENSNLKWSSQLIGHPFVWLAVTGLIVLIAYIWMSQAKQALDVVSVHNLTLEAASIDVEKAEKVIKQDSMAISNARDAERSEQFIQEEYLEKNITPLLESAQTHIANGEFSLPAGDNAWEDFRHILELQPDNSHALSGLTTVENLLIDNAEMAIESGDFEDAENWLGQLDVIQPGNLIQSDLRNDIKTQIELNAKAKLED